MKRRHILFPALWCIVFGGFFQSASAQLVRAYIVEDSVTVGDRLTLVVVAEHDQNSTVAFPAFEPGPGQAGGQLGDLLVFGPRTQGQSFLGVGYDYPMAESLTYEVATFALDSAFVPQISVTVSKDGRQLRFASDPFFFPVASLVSPESTALRDITPLAPFRRSPLPYILLLAALVAGVLLYRKWSNRPPKPQVVEPEPVVVEPIESPIEEARRRLAALEEHELADAPAQKAFYVELSDTLRTYLERKLDVRALESTTAELYREMTSNQLSKGLPTDIAEDSRTILLQADLVKFAKYRYPKEQSWAALGETRVLILRIEDQFRPGPPPTQVQEDSVDDEADAEDTSAHS